MRWLKNNLDIVVSILLITFTLAVFGPIELYCTNNDEFWFSFKTVLCIALIMALICISILGLISIILKGKARAFWGGLIFAAGVALYIQGNYANLNLGVLDGTEIHWNSYSIYAVLDTAGWIILMAVLGILFIKKRNVFRAIQKYISLYIIAVQMVSLTYLVITSGALENKSEFYLSSEGMYTVSDKKNIVVFILDAFDDAYFQEIYNENPAKYEEIFEDFTYYNNAAVGAARTKAALPAIITGAAYPGEISYAEYVKTAFDSDALYSELKRQNYDVRIYTSSVFVPDGSQNLVDNQEASGYKVKSFTGLARKYFDLVLYKYMPYIAKPYFWIYSGDFDQFKAGTSIESYIFDDDAFLKGMEFSVTDDKNVFRLYHLNGAHGPYWLNDMAQAQSSPTDVNQQAKGSLYIVENYLNELKRLGIYDDSTIIIMADHGDENEEYEIQNAAHAILFAKPQNKKSKFTVSSAPVSYFDLHATLFSELGIEKGESLWDIPEGEERERYYYEYSSNGGSFEVHEFLVLGSINDIGSLQETGKVLTPSTKDEKYKYGNVLTFGANSSALPFIVSGISGTDPGNYAWTLGKKCEFKFELNSRPKDNLLVTIKIVAAVTENGPQELLVAANDHLCFQTQILDNTRVIQFVIPGKLIEDKELTLRLLLPDAISPKEISGKPGDPRVLSLALSSLCIEQTTQIPEDEFWELPGTISIACTKDNADLQQVLRNGFSYPENHFTWTNNVYASVVGILKKNPENAINCTIKLLAVQNNYQQIKISSMGETLYIGEVDANTEQISFEIPKECVNEGILSLRLELPDAASAEDLKDKVDKRRLGIAIKEIDFQ